MGKPSERIYIIEADPHTGEVDRAKVLQVVSDFIGTLFAVGGKLQLAADRVIVGSVQVGESVQEIGETQGLIVRYQSFAPARRHDEPAPPLEDEQPPPVEAEVEEYDVPVGDRDDLMSEEEIRALQESEQRVTA